MWSTSVCVTIICLCDGHLLVWWSPICVMVICLCDGHLSVWWSSLCVMVIFYVMVISLCDGHQSVWWSSVYGMVICLWDGHLNGSNHHNNCCHSPACPACTRDRDSRQVLLRPGWSSGVHHFLMQWQACWLREVSDASCPHTLHLVHCGRGSFTSTTTSLFSYILIFNTIYECHPNILQCA